MCLNTHPYACLPKTPTLSLGEQSMGYQKATPSHCCALSQFTAGQERNEALDQSKAAQARQAARYRGLLRASDDAVIASMSTKTREVIWGGRIMGAKMRAQTARQEARKAARAADRAEAEAWSVRMEGYGGPAQPSPTIGQCLNGGYGWLEIECCRCKTRASMPLDAIRRARDTPIWKLEPSFRCRSCGTRRYKPPVRMIKLTEQREITPYKWVHPDEER